LAEIFMQISQPGLNKIEIVKKTERLYIFVVTINKLWVMLKDRPVQKDKNL
jgi:hypothetical protein